MAITAKTKQGRRIESMWDSSREKPHPDRDKYNNKPGNLRSFAKQAEYAEGPARYNKGVMK